MPTTDTKPTSLIINKLTRTQYDTAVKDPNQLYATTDTHQLFLGTVEVSGGIALQSGKSGKFLRTDGSTTSWETVDALPSQAGQAGKILGTDGTDASWISVSECHVVLQTKKPTAADPTWYRLYSDGWVEQGGRGRTTVASGVTNIQLPIEMADTEYMPQITDYATATASIAIGFYNRTKTTVGVVCNASGRGFVWEVKGYAAQ